jgi:diguanylate cyclase (GGDEF)-like protein
MARGEVHGALDRARGFHYEDHDAALDEAIRAGELARAHDDVALRCRALVLQAAVMLQRGDLHGAVALTTEAEPHAELSGDDVRAELAAVKAQLNFFAGSYAEALQQAERAIELADHSGDLELRIFVRRYACVVFGNLGVHDWPERLDEVLGLAVAAGSRWEEAMSRNDLAHLTMEQGDLEDADRQIDVGLAAAAPLAPRNRFAIAVLHCTRAEIRLRGGRAEDSLADARHAVDLLAAMADPNPYLLAMSVVIEVRALLALERLDEAERAGRDTVERLGDRVPQARSMILGTVAEALHDAGRADEAYRVLTQAMEIERSAFRELAGLQRGLERATIEIRVAREQADRDYLTGLHNRRYLAREVDRHLVAPLSVAVVDLDGFKGINDRFGHEVGDRVLMRVAALLLGGVRSDDLVVRTGGEEFLVLMPQTERAAAAACCERVRAMIRDEPWDGVAPGLTVTASVGVACADDASDLRGLTDVADRRLYEAKRTGRDRVVV